MIGEIKSAETHLDKLSDATTEKISLNSHDARTVDEYECTRTIVCSRRNLIYIILSIVIFIGISMIVIVIANDSSPANRQICLSDECLRSATGLKQTMNRNVDPCDDFYEYVCGNWAEDRTERDDGNGWMQERQLKIYRNIRAHLERDAKRFDPKPVAQAKVMYRSCLGSAGQRKAEAVQEIVQNLREFGLPTIPSFLNQGESTKFDWVVTLARIQRKLGLNILIGFEVMTDYRDSNQSRIRVDYRKPSNPLGGMVIKTDNDKINNATILAQILSKLVNTINSDFNSTKYENSFVTLAEKYLEFWNDLSIDLTIDNDQVYDWSLYSIQDLQRVTESDESFSVWDRYFEELFAPFAEAHPTSEDKLLIDRIDLEYLKRFVKLMAQQEPQVIEVFIWHRVAAYLTFHAFEEKKSKEICARSVQSHIPLAVTYTIADEKFLTDIEPRLQQMLGGIREGFNQIVLDTSWMDAKTKNATLEKALAMRSFIGFPEWVLDVEKLEQFYDGLQITKSLYIRNMINAIEFFRKKMLQSWRKNHGLRLVIDPTEVDAVYSAQRNRIFIPVALVQYPFYYRGLEALNYGAIGTVLGHELTHGFDSNGRFFDKFGNMRTWWSAQTHREYETRANCLVEQYNSYSLPEGFVNGTRTLGENIADNGGVREALRAYQAFVKRHGPEPTLPGFDDFSHEQLFFISFANLWCSTLTPARAKALLSGDAHSPGKFRVRGTVSNMPEFSEAFRCAPGTAMNPARKCRVW
ncbi:neprilysin-like [Culex quinquefasciatus]|uniref:neprilysin-like n=1 Tax=Culex quinquefasciatus TaxID=7176 RepID=UPI0018E297C2|nr:neprilysin-like [Culex quinquefasciatus]